MFGRERKLAALRRVLKGNGWGRGDEVSFFCPLPRPEGCGGEHHKQKLAVNLATDFWHCWVCGQGGRNLLRLLALGGKDHPDYVEYAAEIEKPKEALPERQYERVRLPMEFRPLCVPWQSPYYRQAISYLARRGITPDDILTYKLGYCESGRYAERIIVPSFDEYGELNFFVGRAVWERLGLPYLSGKFDKDIIFNDLLVDWERPITLVEGPFDAIKAGTNAVALQGKFMSPRLFDKILARKPEVRVALDDDAWEDSLRIMEKLMGFGIDVQYVELGGKKDPGEMSHDEFLGCPARPVRGPLDLVRLRVQHSSSLEHR